LRRSSSHCKASASCGISFCAVDGGGLRVTSRTELAALGGLAASFASRSAGSSGFLFPLTILPTVDEAVRGLMLGTFDARSCRFSFDSPSFRVAAANRLLDGFIEFSNLLLRRAGAVVASLVATLLPGGALPETVLLWFAVAIVLMLSTGSLP